MGPDPGSLTGLGHYVLTTALMLAMVLGLAAGSLWLLRRFVPLPRGTRNVRIIESVSLEPRRSLYLLKMGERYLLVGSAEGGISLLREFDADEVDVSEAGRKPLRFLDLLRKKRKDDDGNPES